MKILIDYITPLSPEIAEYRKKLIREIAKTMRAKILILADEKKVPFKKVQVIDPKGEAGLLRLTKAAKLGKVIQKYRPDLFITFSHVKTAIKKQVTTYLFAEEMISRLPQEPGKRQARVFDDYTRLIVRSKYSQLLISNNYLVNKERIFVMSSGIDEQFLRTNIPNDIRDVRRVLTIYRVSAPYLITFARLEEQTNIESTIEAFSKLHLKYPDLKLVIASPDYKIGWDNKPVPLNKKAEALLELTDHYKVNRKVIFTGVVDREHLPLLLANADAVINLSINKSFSLSLLESLAAEVPLIISDWPVHKEIAQNAAKVASPQVVTSVYDAINTILSEEEVRTNLAHRASKRVPDFLWANIITSLFEQITFDLSHKPRRQLGLIYETDTKEYFSKVFEKYFDVVRVEKPLRENKSHVIINLDLANYKVNLSLIFKSLIDKQTKLAIFLPDWYFERRQHGIKEKLLVKLRMFLDRFIFSFAYDYAIVSNPLYLRRLQKQLGFKEKRSVFMPVVMEESQKQKKLGSNRVISARVSSNTEIEIVEELKTRLKKRFRTLKLITISDSDDPAKKEDSIAASSIYIELNKNTTQHNILKTFEYKNVCICPKSFLTRYLVKEGINGYHFMDSPLEVVDEIATLLENKTHLNDMRKINYARFEEYKLGNVQKQMADFVDKL